MTGFPLHASTLSVRSVDGKLYAKARQICRSLCVPHYTGVFCRNFNQRIADPSQFVITAVEQIPRNPSARTKFLYRLTSRRSVFITGRHVQWRLLGDRCVWHDLSSICPSVCLSVCPSVCELVTAFNAFNAPWCKRLPISVVREALNTRTNQYFIPLCVRLDVFAQKATSRVIYLSCSAAVAADAIFCCLFAVVTAAK